MLILTDTLKTFDNKVNKIKSLAKKRYYLQKTLKKINEKIDLDLWWLNDKKQEYLERLSKYPTSKDPATLDRIRFNLRIILPEQKNFRLHVLTLLKELEPAKNETN